MSRFNGMPSFLQAINPQLLQMLQERSSKRKVRGRRSDEEEKEARDRRTALMQFQPTQQQRQQYQVQLPEQAQGQPQAGKNMMSLAARLSARNRLAEMAQRNRRGEQAGRQQSNRPIGGAGGTNYAEGPLLPENQGPNQGAQLQQQYLNAGQNPQGRPLESQAWNQWMQQQGIPNTNQINFVTGQPYTQNQLQAYQYANQNNIAPPPGAGMPQYNYPQGSGQPTSQGFYQIPGAPPSRGTQQPNYGQLINQSVSPYGGATGSYLGGTYQPYQPPQPPKPPNPYTTARAGRNTASAGQTYRRY